MNTTLTFDASPSQRETDENGFLHVGASHITKATVNPYYGREIPGWQEAGLDPETVYYGLRDPEDFKHRLRHGPGCRCTSSTISTARKNRRSSPAWARWARARSGTRRMWMRR